MWRFAPPAAAGTMAITFPLLEEYRRGRDNLAEVFQTRLKHFVKFGSDILPTMPPITNAPASSSSDSSALPTRTLSAMHVLGRTRCNTCGGVYCLTFFPDEFSQKYKLVDADEFFTKLGEGGFGSVVRCIHKGTGIHKAAKLFDKDEAQGLRAWKRCGKHPNIVELVDHFSSGDSRSEVAVMDLCHGIDICDYIAEVGDIAEGEAGQIFKQMVRSLTHVHGSGVLHRDIKLENFIFAHSSLDDEGSCDAVSIRLGDFGLARCMDEDDESDAIQGTPLYMPPEVLEGEPFTPAGDVYALGVCLFILLTRHFPYNNTLPRGEPQWDLLKNCSPQARDLVRGMLQPDPAKRMRLHDVASHPFCTRSKSVFKRSDHHTKKSNSLSKIVKLSTETGGSSDLELKEISKGEVLFREGEEGNDVYLVNEGSVEVWKDGKLVATLEEGDIIGEMALLYSVTRSATIIAGPDGAKLYVVRGGDARDKWKNKKSLTTLRSFAEISSQRDEFNSTLNFFQEIYPNLGNFVVSLVEALGSDEDNLVHRIREGESVTDLSSGGSNKIYCVRTGELSVFDNDVLLFKVPPGSFIAKPALFKKIDASDLIPSSFSQGSRLTIVAQEETELMDLTIPLMHRLQHRNPTCYTEFLKQAIGKWKKS